MTRLVRVKEVGEYSVLISYTGNNLLGNISPFLGFVLKDLEFNTYLIKESVECDSTELLYFNCRMTDISKGDICLLGLIGYKRVLSKCTTPNVDILKVFNI